MDIPPIFDDEPTPQHQTGVAKILDIIDLPDAEVGLAIVNQVLDGHINPIEVHMAMKRMEKILKAVTGNKKYKESVQKEVNNLDKGAKYKGHSIITKNGKTIYNYKECGDPLWTAWADIAATAKVKLAEIEESLKAGWPQNNFNVPKRTVIHEELPTLVMEPSGEVSTIFQPTKKQITVVAVTFNKNK